MASDPFDQALQQQFDALRSHDRAVAPDFSTMVARARQASNAAPADAPAPSPRAEPSIRPRRWFASPWTWVVPALAAAGLAAVMLMPRQDAADREFESLVADWSRVTQTASRAPTDGLLAVPGSEYLRAIPQLVPPPAQPSGAAPQAPSRPRSPS